MWTFVPNDFLDRDADGLSFSPMTYQGEFYLWFERISYPPEPLWGKGNQRVPPMPKEDYTERVEVVPYDDGWPGFEEKVLEV